MQGKLFQRCTHFFVLQFTAWHGINFHKNNLWNILVIGNYYVNFQNFQNEMLLSSSDTKPTLMLLFLFSNSAQRELVSMYPEYTRPQLTFLALVPCTNITYLTELIRMFCKQRSNKNLTKSNQGFFYSIEKYALRILEGSNPPSPSFQPWDKSLSHLGDAYLIKGKSKKSY